MGPEILTIEEVAGMLRVSERTVYEWAQKGEIPGGKLGTSWRFVRSEIEGWLSKKLTPRELSVPPQAAASIESVLAPERAFLIPGSTKAEALGVLIDALTPMPGVLSKKELADAIFSREQLMSTGIGLGIGIPHARLNGVKNVFAAIVVCKNPLTDYESLDKSPVSIVVMILAGRDQHALYINILSSVSKILKEEGARDALRGASTTDEIYRILTGKGQQ